MDHDPEQEQLKNHRTALKAALAGGTMAALLVPGNWMKPVVESIIVPAHARTSTAAATTTPAPTTTLGTG